MVGYQPVIVYVECVSIVIKPLYLAVDNIPDLEIAVL